MELTQKSHIRPDQVQGPFVLIFIARLHITNYTKARIKLVKPVAWVTCVLSPTPTGEGGAGEGSLAETLGQAG